MTFLDHIKLCNKHDLSRFRELKVAGKRIGWIKDSLQQNFSNFSEYLGYRDSEFVIGSHLSTSALRGNAMDKIGQALYEQKMTKPPLDEFYSVGYRFGQSFFQLNRAYVSAFGVRAYGIHLTGYVRKSGNIFVWVPRRASDRVVYPGKWDNTVAGGQPAGISLQENLIKECAEEANIGPAYVAHARPVGTISYRHELQYGLRDDLIFAYELELPLDFQPTNTDGEVEDFQLWPVEEVMDVVAAGDDFKFNCNLVLIDFFIRHGILTKAHQDFDEIRCQLYRMDYQ
tara:strand:- start:696 stop:1550 length:855 start_codon:yes stop_codon:yes gene_type:complete